MKFINYNIIILRKSLISKENAIQTAENERMKEEMGLKTKAAPVFFISMVGVDEKGIVDEYEHIFDLFTKMYDFHGSDVHVISAQDLLHFFASKYKVVNRETVDIYTLVEYFVENHPEGNFIADECPFIKGSTYENGL